jgi:hypothetical protein
MKVGLVAPPWLPVPPPAYGGTELVIDILARTLHDQGHQVLLCASGDSTSAVPRLNTIAMAPGTAPTSAVAVEIAHVTAAYGHLRRAGVDVVHDHTLIGPCTPAAFPHYP